MWSNKYISIPFLDKGRDEQGCDCWGLVRLVYQREVGLDLPSFLDYKHTDDFEAISKMINENQFGEDWVAVDAGQEQPLDVCVFKMMGAVAHVGIVVKKGLMLHCQRGSCTTHAEYLKDANWSRRLEGIYRHAEHTDRSITI